jgi:OPA family sugar phosphate sensor protein UhpC-like MFS transporter
MLKAFATGPDVPLRTDANVDAAYRRHRLSIIVAITAGYALSYTCRLALNVVKKPLIDGGVFTASDLGTIGSALFYTYAFGKLINGFISDHANAKRFMAVGLFFSALCNLLMGFSTTVFVATLVWGINGWFQSYGAPACVVSLASWFSNKERGRFYGIWSTAHSLGEGLNFIAGAAIVAALGWQWGFWGPAVAVIVAAVGCYIAMADRPRTMGLPAVADWKQDHYVASTVPADEAAAQHGVFATQLTILKIPAVWVCAFSSALVYVTRYAITSWGMLYLQEARGYTAVGAGVMLAVNTAAGIVGAVGFGYISDKWFGARRPPANLLFGVVEVIGLLLFFYGPVGLAWTAFSLFLFGLGMTGLVTSLGGLFSIDICPKRVAGAALGMVGVFSYLGAALQDQISGKLIDAGMTMVNGVRHYDFTVPILFWVGASVMSVALASTLWNARLRD